MRHTMWIRVVGAACCCAVSWVAGCSPRPVADSDASSTWSASVHHDLSPASGSDPEIDTRAFSGAHRKLGGRGVFGNDSAADAFAPVAQLHGKRISKGRLADFWFERYPEEYARTVQNLVDRELIYRRAKRLGLKVPRSVLDNAVAQEVEARRKQIASLYGPRARLEDEVRRAYGVGLAVWANKILRRRLYERLLLERLVRLQTRGAPRVHARVIVLLTEADARRVAAKVNRGADFSLVAMRESKDPTGKAGGDLPPIARGDLAHPQVEAKLFAAAPGHLVGPLQVVVEGRRQFHLYKIIAKHPPWSGDLAALERDLTEQPVRPAEVDRWRARAHREGGLVLYRPDGSPWVRPK